MKPSRFGLLAAAAIMAWSPGTPVALTAGHRPAGVCEVTRKRPKARRTPETPTTAIDRIALTNAALKRETRAFKRLAWAVESNAGQRCERSRVRMTGKVADLIAARLTVQS